MDVGVDAAKEIVDEVYPEGGGAYPPPLVRLAWLALSQGEPASTYAFYEVKDDEVVWTLIGVQGSSFLHLEARAAQPQWTLHADSKDGRITRAEVVPAHNVVKVALLDVHDGSGHRSDVYRLVSRWKIEMADGQSFTLPVQEQRPEGWHARVDEFVRVVRQAAFDKG